MTTSKDKNDIEISVVIPVFNESENIKPLIIKLDEVLIKKGKTFEIIMVDDGSTDNSFEVMRKLIDNHKKLRIIRFRRNFGQTSAFSAGFDLARGDIVVTLDSDLQNDPADIPKLLKELDKGYDMVSGWRKKRHDNFLTRQLPSRIANYIISKFTGVPLHDYGCSLKAYRSEIIKNIKLYGEMHRFIPAVASWMGISVSEVEVNHAPRVSGKSNYGIMRTIRVLLDLITVKFLLGYSTKPLQVFGLIGIVSFLLGLIIAAYLSATKILFGHPLSDRPMLLMAGLLIIFGVQLCSMGLIGEMVVRTYYESNDKPTYVIKEIIEAEKKE
jgi:glycosyltransferase involved in cell wall biosynthesis